MSIHLYPFPSVMRPHSLRALSLRFVFGLVLALIAFSPVRAEAQEKVYNGSEVTVAPKLADLKKAKDAIERSWPPALKSRKIGGKVAVQFTVLKDGTVDANSIQVVSAPSAALGDAATEAVKKLLFKPGEVDGAPVAVRVLFPIVYSAD